MAASKAPRTLPAADRVGPRSLASVRVRPHLVAALLVTAGVAIPAAMMIHGAIVLDVSYKSWTWFALPIAWGLAFAAAMVAARHPMRGGLLLMLTCAPAATVFWRELGILTFGGAWLIGGWIYFVETQRFLERTGDEVPLER
jgi:hypothetical protein